ncbi:MAG: hypothetical protein IE925_16600 [Rhodobacterales bacterium]|nr:hypothetical protein [Flavobacteriaceae bacterium]MBD3771750.1 hypothetical protein [Rhodobacterales bacterium]MBD3776075.1 hypothetical protein [Thiotrichales bacterium]MBD3828903.1 hypothetical protein [Arcobacter sp.]
MVNDIKQLFEKYKSKESIILEAYKLSNNNLEDIKNVLKDFNIDSNIINNVIDSYLIVSQGSKVDKNIKNLINDISFIDENPSLLQDLAKIYFYCDEISFENNEISIRKKIITKNDEPEQPNIDIDKTIYIALQKIKYNKMDTYAINKISELGNYSKYVKLHSLLMKAIEYQEKIKKLDDNECKIDLETLENLLIS